MFQSMIELGLIGIQPCQSRQSQHPVIFELPHLRYELYLWSDQRGTDIFCAFVLLSRRGNLIVRTYTG